MHKALLLTSLIQGAVAPLFADALDLRFSVRADTF